MARKTYYIGSQGPFFYDEGESLPNDDNGKTQMAFITEGQMRVEGPPTQPSQTVRLEDIEGALSVNMFTEKAQLLVSTAPESVIPLTPPQEEGLVLISDEESVGGIKWDYFEIDWENIENLPDLFPPASHTHIWEEIEEKPTEFPPIAHTHNDIYYSKDEVDNLIDDIEGFSGDWEDLQNKPNEFPPSSHNHDWADVVGKPEEFPPSEHNHDDRYYTEGEIDDLFANLDLFSGDWADLNNVPSTFPPSEHSHIWDSIDEKPNEYPPAAHDHDDRYYTESEVDALINGIDLFSGNWNDLIDVPSTFPPSGHTHDWDSIEDKPSTFPPSTHSHSWSQITGKPTLFPPSSHNHDDIYYGKSEVDALIDGIEGFSGDWDDLSNVPDTFPPSAHSHAWEDVTGKPVSFPPISHNHDDRYYTENEVDNLISGLNLFSGSWDDLTDVPNTFPPLSHQHSWGQITGKPSTFTPSAHTHPWDDVIGKPSTFPPSSHNHDNLYYGKDEIDGLFDDLELFSGSWDDIIGKPSTFPPSAHNHSWSQITGKPTSFPPSSHNHVWSDISNPPATATSWPTWGQVTGKPSTFAPSTHNHPWSEITGKPSTFPPSSHNHAWEDITGKPSTYPPSSHNHNNLYYLQSEIDDMIADLDLFDGTWGSLSGKPSTFPPSSHSHPWGEVTGKPTTFPPSAHGHPWSDLSGIPAFASRWPSWSEVTSKPSTFAPSAHTHGSLIKNGSGAWLDGNSSPRDFEQSLQYRVAGNNYSPNWPGSYGHVFHQGSWSSGQDGAALQLWVPYRSPGDGEFSWRSGRYSNQGWTSWQRFASKEWAEDNLAPIIHNHDDRYPALTSFNEIWVNDVILEDFYWPEDPNVENPAVGDLLLNLDSRLYSVEDSLEQSWSPWRFQVDSKIGQFEDEISYIDDWMLQTYDLNTVSSGFYTPTFLFGSDGFSSVSSSTFMFQTVPNILKAFDTEGVKTFYVSFDMTIVPNTSGNWMYPKVFVSLPSWPLPFSLDTNKVIGSFHYRNASAPAGVIENHGTILYDSAHGSTHPIALNFPGSTSSPNRASRRVVGWFMCVCSP